MQGVAAADSPGGGPAEAPRPSRYESQKRRDWHTFGQYLRNHRPPLELARCSGANVLEFLRYLDQFGKTKVHANGCPFFGHPSPPAPCPCPLRQAWGSLDALVGRLRAAFEEHGGRPEANPFGARAVRLYLREIRDSQAKARGIAYEKKRRKRPPPSSAQKAAKPAASPPTPTSSTHVAPPPPADRAQEVVLGRAVQAQGHYFIPHPHQQHFMHGHFLMPGAGHHDAGAVAASSSSGNSNGHSNGHSVVGGGGGGGGGGDEIAMAMAAAAEAHAAGCMLPLSVFN